MARSAKAAHVSETPATALLRAHGVAFTEHPYDYVEHGGATHSAEVLGFDPYAVVKTLVMQDQDGKPLIVLMHGNRKVSTKNLARQIGAKSVEPCAPEVASTIIGVTSLAQLDEDLNAWGTTLSPELLKAIDTIRWEVRDPAL